FMVSCSVNSFNAKTMSKGKEITFYERERIETYLRMKKKKTWIAKKLNRDYSVIKREVKRNSGKALPYSASNAQHYAERRKKNTNKRKLEKYDNQKLKEYVEEKLEEGWSPEQIGGTLKEQPPNKVKECRDKTISYESIYDYIYNEESGLYKNLRRKQSKRQRRFSRKQRHHTLKNRVSIHKRDKTVDERKRFGDWETDSVIFSGKSILSTQFERKSKLCRIHKCADKSAFASEEALRDSIDSLPGLWLTITRDNGTENVLHHETKVPSYFCDPYSSWQKGGVENLNGLVREYFPKKSNLDTISDQEIYLIQEKLNDRPRKCLNYLTPNDVIATEIKKGL
ncbi:MAG: IS30 family transposase, partial [Candidatus Pacebacteria bacterium]|nr:IS30 family transposase [Candidatus Paceibacterota bacterium]